MSSAEAGGDERPRREVAHRVFAAEFDDATLSYSESDEERAPNYVVTPTGARANRLFVAGVLTELEELSNGQLRARIVDPTGAFVVYAGQYQPDALAALERLSVPSFVAVTGKARTFQPDDSNRVFTSIRPETISEIDATTRDRWIVETAARTLDRVGEFATHLADGTGDDGAVSIGSEAGGATGADGLRSGVALAREHYGTTAAYLAAVRELALDATRLVAGDVEEVGALDRTPGEEGAADLAALASSPLGGTTVATIVDSGGDSIGSGDRGGVTTTPVESEPDAEAERSGSEPDVAVTDSETNAQSPTESSAEKGATLSESDDLLASGSEATEVTGDDGANGTTTTTDTGDGTDSIDRTVGIDDTGDHDGIGGGDDIEITDGIDERSDDEDGESSDDGDDSEEFEGEFDLSDEERAEIEAEYGTDFSTGSEVNDPGEANIEPTAPPVEDDGADGSLAADDTTAESAETADAEIETETQTGTEPDAEPVSATETEEIASDPDVEPEQADGESSGVSVDGNTDTDDTGTERADDPTTEEGPGDVESAESVDVTEEAMDAMRDLDDGDGADRDAIIERVSDEHGVPAADVAEAIQSALMGGQCYEPGDGTLKAI